MRNRKGPGAVVGAAQRVLEVKLQRPAEVRGATLDVLEGAEGEGIILSVGGGTSPGMPRQNIVAMLEALQEFNASRLAGAR